MLELKDVMLFISEEHVLSHLSVVAQEGEVTCLTGAAAPVVLRAMMGFVLPREGDHVDDVVVRLGQQGEALTENR